MRNLAALVLIEQNGLDFLTIRDRQLETAMVQL